MVLSMRPVTLARPLHAVALVVGVTATAAGLSLSGGAAIKQVAIVFALSLPAAVWLVWLGLRTRPARELPPPQAGHGRRDGCAGGD